METMTYKKFDMEKVRKGLSYPKNEYDEINEWRYNEEANCYQFALRANFTYFERLLPGEIAGHEIDTDYAYTDQELIRFVEEDLAVLGFEMEECMLECTLEKDEWEIAIFNTMPNSLYADFHFMRRLSSSRYWLQKFVGEQHPTPTDVNNQIISDPARAKHYNPRYKFVGYYRIRKKNENEG